MAALKMQFNIFGNISSRWNYVLLTHAINSQIIKMGAIDETQ